jgi:adenosylhomocysteine nucleosidase
MSGAGEERSQAEHLGIIAAFRREVAPLLRRRRDVARVEQGVYSFSLNGEPIVLAISGMGEENARRAARALLQRFSLHAVFSVGFAGGLSDAVVPGALVVADEVIDASTGQRYPCRASLLGGPSGRRGGLLCARRIISSAEQKRLLGQKWNALAVDMESGGVARVAAEAGLPFGALKTITDSVEHTMAIDFQRCRSDDGRLSKWRLVREAITSPGAARDLWRLAGNSRRAAITLAAALNSD